MKCPCHSGLPFTECCEPYLTEKELPESALQLMRSRYTAYALKDPDYIIKTTHPENPTQTANKTAWKEAILIFCKRTDFKGLKIIEFVEGNREAFVTFYAHLFQGTEDASFEETSRFLKEDNRWLYHSGVLEIP